MKLRDELNALTPRLRRYARALATGNPHGSEVADDLVHATLMRALGSRNLGTHSDLVVRVYATLTQLYRDIAMSEQSLVGVGVSHMPASTRVHAMPVPTLYVRQTKLTAGLMELALEDREALLLVALENFDHGEAARILRISRTCLFMRLTRARSALATHLQAYPGRATNERDRRRPTHLRLVE